MWRKKDKIWDLLHLHVCHGERHFDDLSCDLCHVTCVM
jgi:hypothetical protein